VNKFPGDQFVNLQKEFDSRGPWVTKFEVNGVSSDGKFDALNDVRIEQFFNEFPNVRTVLELGSLEGGHSFAIARNPAVEKVVAVEARKANIEKASFIQNLLDIDNVEFIEMNLERSKVTELGQFDAVFCSGVLYHLGEPWKLIEQCSGVSPRIFIWSQYACEKEARKLSNGYRGKWWREGGWGDPLSGVSKWSFWLSLGSLLELLTVNEYDRINIIENNLTHPHGCAVTLSAERS